MKRTLLTADEKERLAFRAEALTLLCSMGSVLSEIHMMMHATPEERERLIKKSEDIENPLGDHIDSNNKAFISHLQAARSLPDDEELFFKELLKLRDKR